MTNEKQKEMIKKILEATIDDTPSKSLDGYREVAVEYLNMINKVITPMNPFTAPIAAAALGVMKEIVMKEMNSEVESTVKSIEMLLKVSIRSEKVPYQNKKGTLMSTLPAKIRKIYFSNKLIIPLFADFFKGTAYEKKVYRQHNRFYRTILG